MLIKDIPLIWPLSMLPSIRRVSRRLILRVQQVAFYFKQKSYPVRVYTPVTEIYPMCEDPLQDRLGTLSFCHRDIAETTVFICEQKSYPKVFMLA